MAIIKPFDIVHSLEIRGRIGRPNGLGEIWCGWSELGEDLKIAGIYQKRPRPNGQIFVRMKHYHCRNPKTIPQQANRSIFADAVASWQACSEAQKSAWRRKKYPRGMSGYHRYLRNYMRTH